MSSSPSLDERVALLMRGVTFGADDAIRVAMARELRERLAESDASGRPLRVYLGVDPTATQLHLGHAVPLRKLRQFQDLGHQVIFLIGSFTARIGDPSDKSAARPQQSAEDVRRNAATYVDQVWRVLDRERTTVEYNDRWLAPLSFEGLIELASQFTVQQFLTRDNFRRRTERDEPIWLHELFYALMQAYDAVALRTDVQVGGTEQLFNLMAGRKLMEARGLRPQVCLTLPILVGTDGAQRMSKSSGNTIGIAEAPADQYGKVMSLPDVAMRNYADLATRWSPAEIERRFAALDEGTLHPRDLKMALAREIVASLHGDSAGAKAEEAFLRVFRLHEAPEAMPHRTLGAPVGILALLEDVGLAPSRSAARRLVNQGGVRLDGRVLEDPEEVVQAGEHVVQVGKRRFLRLTVGTGAVA